MNAQNAQSFAGLFLSRYGPMQNSLSHAALGIAFVGGLLLAPAARAQAPDAADIAEGMRIFLQKGNCQACHGWAADGRKMDNQMPDGANLRETKLERGDVIEIGRAHV